jgi:PAS domain S-box-containing protein
VNVSNELARRLLDDAPDPSVIVDGEGTIVYANARVTDALGYTPEELEGQHVECLLPERFREIHPTHRSRFCDNPKPRPMGAARDLFALRKDGAEIPVSISLSPVQRSDGMLVCAAIRDVTDAKEVERQLVEANRAKSRFLAAASHDLRQPIQTLNLLNRAAKSRAIDPTHLQIIDKQQNALDSIARLLNSLLDISKLEAGVVKPDIEDCKVQKIFDSLRSEFEDQAHDKGLKLVVERCHGVARSDPRLLTQILENLVANAIRYTQQGVVRLRCLHKDIGIRLQVLDTGLGIPATELERIFEEFHQVDAGSQRPEGLGLGLSIVKRTAHLLGCAVEVESVPGKGSVFSVVVPKGERVTLASEEPAAVSPDAGAGGRVLIVDDEPAVVDATRLLLETEGFVVMTASCAADAVSCLSGADVAPDVVITDYHLRSGETGLGVIRAVREHLGTPIPVILVSGDTSDRIHAAEIDGMVIFKKPVDVDELLREIRRRIDSG